MPEFSRYKLVRPLGVGGMAQVVEATLLGSRGFERRVALKWILPSEASNPSMRAMFATEARILSRLHHSNIVQIVDFGEFDDLPFIAMEYVDGTDLSGVTDMPIEVSTHVWSQVAHALAYVHEARDDLHEPLGLVHRDVSPGNILVSRSGDVKLSDFGIALANDRLERTQTGLVKGKARYMAPEQALGFKLTPAIDVYALAVTFVALTLGKATSLYGVAIDDDAGAISSLPEDVRELVTQCLSVDPKARPTAAEVARRAEGIARGLATGSARAALAEWVQARLVEEEREPPKELPPTRTLIETAPGSRVFREENAAGASDPLVASEPPTVASGSRVNARKPNRVAFATVAAALGITAAASYSIATQKTPTRASARPTSESAASEPLSDEPLASMRVVEVPTTVARLPNLDEPPAASEEPRSTEDSARPERPSTRTIRRRQSTQPDPTPGAAPTVQLRELRAIAVGGRGYAGHEVWIDGRLAGYAPGSFDVTVGSHVVEILPRGASQPIERREVLVRDLHTSVAPLRIFPER